MQELDNRMLLSTWPSIDAGLQEKLSLLKPVGMAASPFPMPSLATAIALTINQSVLDMNN